MLSPLRNRFGIPGAISVIALVFAMLGGAYAASDDSGSGKATASAGKQGPPGPRGKRGKPGPAGPQGPAGPAGAPGAKGDAGANGSNGAPGQNGTNGKDGKDGVSPVGTEFSGNAGTCTDGQGGVEFEGAEEAVTYACNGKEGSPWTLGGTLPPEATMTGAWSPVLFPTASTEFMLPISFPIPLAVSIPKADTTVMQEGATPTAECPGSAKDPDAAPGKFCLYVTFAFDLGEEEPISFSPVIQDPGTSLFAPVEGTGKAGATLAFKLNANEIAYGTWAVTAPAS